MSTDFTLKNAKLFKKYKIVSCNLLPDIKTRFAEMGLVKDTVVTVIKKAPLGDPVEIEVRGYCLCIRQTEAEHFVVEEVE